MLRHTLLLAFFVSGVASVGACHLYVDEDEETWRDDCGLSRCQPPAPPDREDPPPPPPPPSEQLCESDSDCLKGCYCGDEGVCEESNWCFSQADCADGFVCNLLGTCVPAEDPPPATCEDLGSEDACVADEGCNPVYRGVNCTSESGDACTSDTADCSCESFAFDSCEDA